MHATADGGKALVIDVRAFMFPFLSIVPTADCSIVTKSQGSYVVDVSSI